MLTTTQLELLHHPFSLTEKLRSLATRELELKLLHANWHLPTPEIAALLQTNTSEQFCWMREIIFVHHQAIWEWAQTWVTASALIKHPELKYLGNNPLGAILFKENSKFTRTQFDILQIDPQDPLVSIIQNYITTADDCYWLRRSVFNEGTQPQLIIFEALNLEEIN